MGTFYPKREVTKDWRKIFNEEILNLCRSLDIVSTHKSRPQRWPEHIERVAMSSIYTNLLQTNTVVTQA